MNLRTLLLGILIAGLTHSAATAGEFDLIEIKLHPDHPAIAAIKVDGKPDGNYNKILTKTLEYGVYVRGDTPADAVPGTSRLNLKLDGGDWIASTISEEWKGYTLTMPFQDLPQSSPIKLCNDRLLISSGAARQEFLKKGHTFIYEDAYVVLGQGGWYHSANGWEQLKVPVKIRCLGLNRDRTQDGGPSRTSPPVPPLFWTTTFRIEPAKMVRDGRYMCPSQLKLYGFVETGQRFQGKAIFMGPHYLSAITPLNFSYAGSRTMTATYQMKWKEIGGLTTTSDPKPKKQKLTFHFNISNLDGKLIKSVKKMMDVSCTKIEAEAPVGMTGSSPTGPLEP